MCCSHHLYSQWLNVIHNLVMGQSQEFTHCLTLWPKEVMEGSNVVEIQWFLVKWATTPFYRGIVTVCVWTNCHYKQCHKSKIYELHYTTCKQFDPPNLDNIRMYIILGCSMIWEELTLTLYWGCVASEGRKRRSCGQ